MKKLKKKIIMRKQDEICAVVAAQYDPAENAVREERIGWYTVEDAEQFINENNDLPLMAYIDGCIEWDNPYLGIIETDAYRKEYMKIID